MAWHDVPFSKSIAAQACTKFATTASIANVWLQTSALLIHAILYQILSIDFEFM